MTAEDAKLLLRSPYRAEILAALYRVSLGDLELKLLIYRHMRKHTQEEAAEKFKCSVNNIYNTEKQALKKCAAVWGDISHIKSLIQKIKSNS